MVTINLMPWREQAQQYYAEQLKKLLSGVLLLSAIFYSFAVWQLSTIENNLIKRNEFLAAEIHQRNPQQFNASDTSIMAANQLINEMKNIAALNKKILLSLQSAIPTAICLKEIKRSTQGIILAGEVTSSADLLAFFQRWSAINFLAEVRVEKLKQLSSAAMSFQVMAVQPQNVPKNEI